MHIPQMSEPFGKGCHEVQSAVVAVQALQISYYNPDTTICTSLQPLLKAQQLPRHCKNCHSLLSGHYWEVMQCPSGGFCLLAKFVRNVKMSREFTSSMSCLDIKNIFPGIIHNHCIYTNFV